MDNTDNSRAALAASIADRVEGCLCYWHQGSGWEPWSDSLRGFAITRLMSNVSDLGKLLDATPQEFMKTITGGHVL
jgi:hypothetical protein